MAIAHSQMPNENKLGVAVQSLASVSAARPQDAVLVISHSLLSAKTHEFHCNACRKTLYRKP
jgi:hypothetical protein